MTSRTATRRRPTPAPPPRRIPLLPAVLVGVALVAVIGVAVALAGGDSTDGPGGTGSGAAPVFGAVTVEGPSLPVFTDDGPDAALGQPGPTLLGEDATGGGVTVGGAGEPTLVVFLAHWCPHCQAELPVLVDLAATGQLDGIRLVAVLTGTNADAPNYPPVPWLDREGWTGDVLVDDAASTAASAYGLAGYPFIVALDEQGNVADRASGELPAADVLALVEAATRSG
jgi:cytochrome c biogenesis protein CcmG, thiol:disulfide interchange protein DsbE